MSGKGVYLLLRYLFQVYCLLAGIVFNCRKFRVHRCRPALALHFPGSAAVLGKLQGLGDFWSFGSGCGHFATMMTRVETKPGCAMKHFCSMDVGVCLGHAHQSSHIGLEQPRCSLPSYCSICPQKEPLA